MEWAYEEFLKTIKYLLQWFLKGIKIVKKPLMDFKTKILTVQVFIVDNRTKYYYNISKSEYILNILQFSSFWNVFFINT